MDEVAGGATAEEQVLATLDVKDAFLEVPQPTPLQGMAQRPMVCGFEKSPWTEIGGTCMVLVHSRVSD